MTSSLYNVIWLKVASTFKVTDEKKIGESKRTIVVQLNRRVEYGRYLHKPLRKKNAKIRNKWKILTSVNLTRLLKKLLFNHLRVVPLIKLCLYVGVFFLIVHWVKLNDKKYWKSKVPPAETTYLFSLQPI